MRIGNEFALQSRVMIRQLKLFKIIIRIMDARI